MGVATLHIQLNNKVVQAYQSSSPESREKLQKLIALLVQEFTESTPQSLLSLMEEMGQEAATKGLTESVLESLLQDE
jgi:hypothetical protein